MEPTTNLYLIRHGEAWAVKTHVVSGPKGDEGLTPLGRTQAERLRNRLATTREITADALLASTLPRARQTAEIIAPALGLPIQWDDELQEIRVDPDVDGIAEAEFLERYSQPDFERDPFRPLGPRGENWGQFMLRVGTALDRITRAYAGKTVVLVCHGGVIDGAFPFFFGLNTFALPPVGLYTHNTSITHWRLDERNGHPCWRLMRYNDDLHLYDGVAWRELREVAEGDVSRAVPGTDEM